MEDRYLFRAKRMKYNPNEETWVIGSYVHTNDGDYIVVPYKKSTLLGEGKYIEVNPSTLCQCTGLQDKSGKLIFENDIVEKEFYTDYDAHANSEKYKGVIKFEYFSWVVETNGGNCQRPLFDAMAYTNDLKHFEVVGNILDHPELLKNEIKQQEDVELDDDLEDEYEIPFA